MKNPFVLDLLDPEIEDYYARTPKRLETELLAFKRKPDWIVIDEIQKVPKLLDMVHRLIESHNYKFALTGSSARKLKRGSANLLAGRAFVYNLYSLSAIELAEDFLLEDFLHWGGLPRLQSLTNTKDKVAYLNSYILTYLNQEIRLEQIVRNLDPFRDFLEIAGQMSGKIVNHKKIADQVGVDTKTVQNYYSILEDTLLGFYLPAFHYSVRKSQRLSPKFYLFDTGLKKALENSLEQKVTPGTSVFGDLFEQMVILEIHKLNSYRQNNYRLSYYGTKNNSEVDLILSKNGKVILIEIKSSHRIDETEVRKLERISADFKNVDKVIYLSQDTHSLKVGKVSCMHWLEFLNRF